MRPLALAASFALSWPGAALAYDTGSIAGSDCHEQLTRRAITDARASLGLVSSSLPDYVEGGASPDLPLEVDPHDGFDVVAISLANREVDAVGMFDQNQREHCLRSAAQDDPLGSASALEDCRAYIQQQMQVAFDGLIDGVPNLAMRAPLGTLDLSLPQFHLSIGRALHALQDLFSHSYRNADESKVTVVLNYVELEHHVPSIDGPAHSMHLDECVELEPLRRRRFAMAREASTELVAIALDRSLARREKDGAVGDLLARHLSLEEGCTAENDWCDAPEAAFADAARCGCTKADPSGSSWIWIFVLLSCGQLLKRGWNS